MQNKSLLINTYENIGKPTIKSTKSVYDWFKLISKSDYSGTITLAREGNFDYDTVKKSIPCITYNFLYDGYKKDSNLISSTGLMYIDIDESSFNINLLDTSKVLAYYTSFGGKGYAIIVRVDGLVKSNFESTYKAVIEQLGLTDFVDKNAIKASQFNVLSYDEDIFINPNPYIFKSIEPSIDTLNKNTPLPSVIRKKKKHIHTEGGYNSEPLRFDDIDRIEVIGDYIVNWEGFENIKCTTPFRKKFKAGTRNNFLLSNCNNFVYLNPKANMKATETILDIANKRACEPPVEPSQIKRIVKSIFKYKNDGTLKPHISPRKRKIVFDKGCNYTPLEKLRICGMEWNKQQGVTTIFKLYNILEEWDFKTYGKISQPKIYKNNPISKKTVEKYYKIEIEDNYTFKDFVVDLNREFKESKAKVSKSSKSLVKTKEIMMKPINGWISITDTIISIYKGLNLKIDVSSIMDIQSAINKSHLEMVEFVDWIIKIRRENRYFTSPYKHIALPDKFIQWCIDYKVGALESVA